MGCANSPLGLILVSFNFSNLVWL